MRLTQYKPYHCFSSTQSGPLNVWYWLNPLLSNKNASSPCIEMISDILPMLYFHDDVLCWLSGAVLVTSSVESWFVDQLLASCYYEVWSHSAGGILSFIMKHTLKVMHKYVSGTLAIEIAYLYNIRTRLQVSSWHLMTSFTVWCFFFFILSIFIILWIAFLCFCLLLVA